LRGLIQGFSQLRKGAERSWFLYQLGVEWGLSPLPEKIREPNWRVAVESSMKTASFRSARILLIAGAAVGLASAVGFAATQARGPVHGPIGMDTDVSFPQRPDMAGARTLAEIEFPDAPYGVDPIVTGPSSASLRTRQQISGCAEAIWPNIPVDCYPE